MKMKQQFILDFGKIYQVLNLTIYFTQQITELTGSENLASENKQNSTQKRAFITFSMHSFSRGKVARKNKFLKKLYVLFDLSKHPWRCFNS